MKDFGHWSVLKEVDINNYIGFVYVITFENGKKYVGAKKIWKRIKAAPCTFKRGPKAGFEESDWKIYTSSSNELNSIIASGIQPKEYLIVGWYSTWGKTLMAEMEMQLANDVLRNPIWLNKQIGGHFNPNCFDDLTEQDIATWAAWEKGNEHTDWPVMYKIGQKTKYVSPSEIQNHINRGWQFGRSKTENLSTKRWVSSFELYDYENDVSIKVENINEFARTYDLSPGHITRLLQGSLDIIKNRWGLHPSIERQRWKYIDPNTNTKFLTNSEVEEFFNENRGKCTSILKSGKIVKLDVETKESHILKLKSLNLCKFKLIESKMVIEQNSFRDFVKTEIEDKDETIKWLESYIQYLKNN